MGFLFFLDWDFFFYIFECQLDLLICCFLFLCLVYSIAHKRSAFFWFAGDKRPKLKEQSPGATVGEIAKQLGAAWKIMTKEQKYPYEESARKDRGRYETQIKAYRSKKTNAVPEEDEEEEEEEDCISEEED